MKTTPDDAKWFRQVVHQIRDRHAAKQCQQPGRQIRQYGTTGRRNLRCQSIHKTPWQDRNERMKTQVSLRRGSTGKSDPHELGNHIKTGASYSLN